MSSGAGTLSGEGRADDLNRLGVDGSVLLPQAPNPFGGGYRPPWAPSPATPRLNTRVGLGEPLLMPIQLVRV